LGRIIGDSPGVLSVPIWTSIAVREGWDGYEFETPETVWGEAKAKVFYDDSENRFFDSASEIMVKLNNKGWLAGIPILRDDHRAEDFNASVAGGANLIAMTGHGSWGGWAGAVDYNSNLNFGGYSPIVLAFSCLTGDYERANHGGEGDTSLAEKFLEWGAAVYIGSLNLAYDPETQHLHVTCGITGISMSLKHSARGILNMSGQNICQTTGFITVSATGSLSTSIMVTPSLENLVVCG
jgi:hypothetical protein